jgi:hypothetical protein
VYGDDERQPSLFKVGDEWLALPEVFSNLDFTADSTPAKENDIEGSIHFFIIILCSFAIPFVNFKH